ncbi:uncharacterized protein LOC129988815 [Argiope bruennichi]|uniref:uncharacterized protein LOC129988815 n=1 Tax=Argiope bruennichi TaxID=94029 RepID=UPI00249597B3|nr:uncharacterized protein LOC129988815 [Argiope bruennichi]XP_055953062.1 uncharacterized protein LOC129988815 [Argiope bruennichi]
MMAVNEQEWMKGQWNGKVYYSPAQWMKGDWNGDFFYELCKLGDMACVKFCMDNGLISKRYECPKCGDEMKLSDYNGVLWICRKKGGADPHHIKRSLRKGTWFQGSHLSFGLILRLTYMWLNKIPQESIINDLGIASQTASEWKHFCKEVCLDYCLRFDGQIGGTGLTVDIYEAWLSEKKYKIERRAKGNSVFVGLVRHLNDFFVEVVEDRSAEVLIEVIIKRIIPGSTILINCGSLYSSSRSLFEQLEVLHNVTIKETQQSSEGIWFKVKLALQGNEFLDGEFNTEVAEYIWRRRNNYIMTQKVQNFLKTISESFPPKSKD